MMRVLILGGTSDANALSKAVAALAIDAIYSYAGRTQVPVNQPLPVRTGGFGGVDGLASYIVSERITHVVDATHPFAGTMSRNAVAACAATATPLLALVRPPWAERPGDRWTHVPDLESAARALSDEAMCIFLAIGRQHLEPFATKPQHTYLLRFVDAPDEPLPFPKANVVVSRGPFTQEDDLALLRSNGVSCVVTRNSGGSGARAKIDAARSLNLPVIMIARPEMPVRTSVASVEDALSWLHHETCLGA